MYIFIDVYICDKGNTPSRSRPRTQGGPEGLALHPL